MFSISMMDAAETKLINVVEIRRESLDIRICLLLVTSSLQDIIIYTEIHLWATRALACDVTRVSESSYQAHAA